jgi:hypothetical protein
MGTELQFIDGAELRKQDVYDEIPKAFGERVVVFPNGGRPDAVSFVYCEPYESLKDAVRKHFEGVASIREVTTDSQPICLWIIDRCRRNAAEFAGHLARLWQPNSGALKLCRKSNLQFQCFIGPSS